MTSIDYEDVARFERLSHQWWDAKGPMRALHQFNPIRLRYLREYLSSYFYSGEVKDFPLQGLRVLDIGCGAGLLSEPLTRLGAEVTGIDPGHEMMAVAQRHAAEQGLLIHYHALSVEEFAASMGAGDKFDVVLALEVLEHVADLKSFLGAALSLVRPGYPRENSTDLPLSSQATIGKSGLFIAATINRTLASFALAIVGAEYILNWIPRGTHQWHKFISPEELETALHLFQYEKINQTGFFYHPLSDRWEYSKSLAVNYLMVARPTEG